jgi:hypothetical protein
MMGMPVHIPLKTMLRKKKDITGMKVVMPYNTSG